MISFITVLSLYYAFILNYPIIAKFYDLSISNSGLFPYISPLLLTFAFIIIFSILALPYLYKGLFIALTVTSALTFYASITYNVMFDYAMMENIFETNSAEAFTYLNSRSVLYFIIFGALPSFFIYKVKIISSGRIVKELFLRLALVLFAIAGIGLIALFFYKDYASVGRNNSYLNKMINPAHVFNSVKYINNTYLKEKLVYKFLGQDATLASAKNGKPTLMFLIVGETARAQNSFYNGYSKNTNPYTQNMDIIAFQDVSSCGTATAHSLPCMFSNLSRDNYNRDRAEQQDGLLDVMSHAGVDLLWLENDGGDKEVAKNIPKIVIDHNASPDLCDGSSCYDEILLADIDRQINANKDNKMIALHIMGSHGPTYWQRYPQSKAVFKPACNQSDIENCSDQEIVNVYDNTLVYTDYFISLAIKKLQQYSSEYNVSLVYLSDHGESLGENGLYLHGAPYAIAPDEQTKVPFYMWFPEQYAQEKGIDKQCVIDKAKQGGFSHDNLFHTVLGLYGVKTEVKDNALDIISSCKLGASHS
ncbi:MAG: lipid A ethanolaminephosphotransferase [Oleiphilaceae bacterium]|jgi:lipid A ethanolaminephosphotransferase